jgi:hypothetical protein
MSTTENNTEMAALLEHLSGKPLDRETYQRIHARQEAITAELREQQGERDIAVRLIREVRDGE